MINVLRFEDVNFSYSDNFKLRNISFDVNEGDFISVIGKNGSGKSTLVKLIARIITNYGGKILYEGKDIHSIDRKEYSRNISYLPQSTFYNEEWKVKDFLMLGRYAYKKFSDFTFSEQDKLVSAESINETGINALSDKYFYELSGGERQKVLLTLALVQLDITKELKGKILIIDEPLTYLDVNHQFEIFNILKNLNAKGLTVIIVIHDLNLAMRFSDKTLLMNNGELIKYSYSKEVITEDMLKEHFLIDSKIINFEKNFFINYYPN